MIEPWPSSPDPDFFPYTIIQTAITEQTITHHMTLAKDGPPTQDVTKTTLTVPSTWIIWETAATDMPVGTPPDCGGPCTPSAIKPHGVCYEKRLETRCAAQCTIRDWQWWCYKHPPGDQDPPQGKICWTNSTSYEQLLEPCDHTDFLPNCKQCGSN